MPGFCKTNRRTPMYMLAWVRRRLPQQAAVAGSPTFRPYLRLRPEDATARRRIEQCNQILALDPTQRDLNIQDQYRRSLKLLDLLLTDVRQCLGTPLSSKSQYFIDTAEKTLKSRAAYSRLSTVSEANPGARS
jgi:hypothetical protein